MINRPVYILAGFLLASTLSAQLSIAPAGPNLPAAQSGVQYTQQFTASGGSGNYAWSFAVAGSDTVQFAPTLTSGTGVSTSLQGTPTGTGSISVTITLRDTVSDVSDAQTTYTIQVTNAPSLSQPPGTTAYVINESGTLLSVQGGAAATLYSDDTCNACYDMVRDASGNLIIAAGTEIRMLSPTGVPLPRSPIEAGEGSNYYSVAVDANGNYIVGDNSLHQIWKIAPDGSATTSVATYLQSESSGEDVFVRVDSSGNYVVAEDAFQSLSMFLITPGPNSTVTPLRLRLQNSDRDSLPSSTGGLTFDGNGNYVNVDWQNDLISTITPGGTVSNLFTDGNEIFSYPEGISRDPVSGNYFLVDYFLNALYIVSADGSTAGQIAQGGLLSSPGAVVVVNAQVPVTYVLESNNRIVPLGGAALSCPVTICTSSSHDFAADLAGNFIIADTTSLVRMTPAGVSTVIAAAPNGSQFISVAVDSSGNYIVADNLQHRLLKITPAGAITAIANYPVVSSIVSEDVTVRIDTFGNYVVAEDNGGGAITVIEPDGTVAPVPLTGTFPGGIFGLAIDPFENFIVPDYNSGTIDAISSGGSGNVLFANANGTLSRPFGIFRDPATGDFLVADNTKGAVYSLLSDGSQITQLANGLAGAVSVMVLVRPPLSITTSFLPAGTDGSLYSAQLAAAGGSGTYTWSATGLPPGLSFSVASPGFLSGALPAGTAGSWTVNVTVTDAVNTTFTATQSFPLIVNAALPPPPPPVGIFSSSNVVSVVLGGPVSVNFTGTGGIPPYGYSASGVPAGITVNSNGLLSGSPSQAGAFNGGVTVVDTQGQTAFKSIVINVLGLTTTSLPGGVAGKPYAATISAIGGANNYQFTATNLPAGLALSIDGTLSGTPKAPNTYSLNVSVTSGGLTASTTIALNVLGITTTSLSGGAVGKPYSATISAIGGSGAYQFTGTNLPAGLTLSTDGKLSGTPITPKSYSLNVTVTSGGLTASATLALNVLGFTTTSLPDGTAGKLYSATFAATGGSGAYQFTATSLPTGLSLSSDGTLSGTVKTANTYSLNVSVTSGNVTASNTFALTIGPPPPLSISSAALPDGSLNSFYSQSLTATGGIPPYTWSVINGTPPQGLSLSSTGVVSGTPVITGPGTFKVQVTDDAGASVSAPASLNINSPQLVITTQTLPSGMVTVDYPQQVLGAKGGTPPYVWSSDGAFPSGLSFSSDGQLGGTPSSAGTFNPAFTVVDSKGKKATAALALTIRPFSADIILTSGSLSFSMNIPAVSTPPPATVGVQSTSPAQQLSYSVSVSPASTWLSVTSGTSTTDILQVSITPAALTLAQGEYATTVTVTCTSPVCSGHTQSVAVSLEVSAPLPSLVVGPTLLSFATTSSNTSPISQPITVQNAGGGTIHFTSASCEDVWCSVAPLPDLGGGVTSEVNVTINPGLLKAGYYRTLLDVVSSAGKASVPVTLFISANGTMTLAPAGAQFNMPAGSSPGNPNGSFLVSVNNTKPVSFTAVVIPGANWLRLSTTSGTSTTLNPGTVFYSVDPAIAAGLNPGAYYARIEVRSGDVANSPQDYEVILNIAPANTAVTPDPEPAGLLFITGVGGILPPQTVNVYSSSTLPVGFQTGAAASDGAHWLSVTPASGSAATGAPGRSSVSVNTTGLRAGIYRGGISYALSATAVRTVNVTLIVTGTAGATPDPVSSFRPRDLTCAPTALAPTQTGLVNNFSAPAAWPTPLSIQLSTDCGSPVANGQVVATFSNGDPPLIMALVDPPNAIYSGTWSPRKSSAQLAINVRSSAPGFPAVSTQIAGAVTPNAAPQLTPNAELHAFAPLIGGALAPGTIIQIYGQNLASQTGQPSTVPLPITFNQTQVLIGGEQSPLFYVSPTQVNAQIPFDLLPGQQYQLFVSANGALTSPDTMQLSNATPGLAVFADGTLIAQHPDGSLVSATAPAKAGEYLVAYLVGMGSTNVQLASGDPSPLSPLAQPTDPPTLLINSAPSPLLFAGMTPGLVGLYQMNFQVPASLPAGTVTVAIAQDGQSSNQATLPYQP